MKAKNCFFIIVFLIQAIFFHILFLESAVSQPIPENNIPDSLRVRLIGRWANGPCLAVAVDATGTIACFGNGSYLEIVDISNPANPRERSKILLPATILDVAINGSYTYVSNAGAGLRIIDISNPNNPVEIAYLETLGIASGVVIDGTRAYLADGDRGLLVIDLFDPFNPKKMGECPTAGWASKVAVNGSNAYIADKQGGLRVIDISNPFLPNEIGSYTTTSDVSDVAIYSTFACLAAGAAGLRIIDISNPYNLTEAGFLGGYQLASAIAVQGSYAYLTDVVQGLRIINIANPYRPDEDGFYDTDGSPNDVTLVRNYAFVADGHNGLRVISVSNFYNPDEIGYFITDGSSKGIAVENNNAYLVRWEAGLRVIDISNSSNPSKISSLNLNGWAEDVAINGNYAYLTNYENGLRIIDITDPLAMSEIGFITQNINSKRVALEGNYAYVADTTFGLRVIDISNPSQPTLINGIEFPDKRAEAIVIKDNYAFLAAADDGLAIVDIATPSQARLVETLDLVETAISIDVADNQAYIGTLQNNLYIVNISDPAQPVQQGVLALYNPLYEIIAKARYVYVANGLSGLRVVDVIYPSKPIEVGFYITGGTAFGLTVDEKYIYLSCAETGLFVLEFLSILNNKPPQAPILNLPANNSFISTATPQLTWQVPTDENNDPLHFKLELDKDGNWSNIDLVFESKTNTTGFSPIPPVPSGSGAMNYITQSPLSEGNWYWRVSAWDGLVYGDYSEMWTFMVDTTAPVLNRITFQNPGFGENWFNPEQDTSVTLAIFYDELYPQIASLAGGILPDTLLNTGLTEGINQEVRFNFSIATQPDGTYPLQASIQDSAGNIGTKIDSIILDSTPPAGYFSDAPDTIAEGQIYSVHVFDASDSLGSGVAQIYLDIFIDVTGIPATAQDSVAGITAPGTYYYRYFVEDFLGNQGEIKTDTTVVIPVYPQAPIFPLSQSNQIKAGDDFWIDIQIGTEQQPVENLFSVDFILNYSNTPYIDIVSQDSIVPGELFGEDVNIASRIDDVNGKVEIAISRQPGASNVDGSGILARIKFASNPSTPDQTTIHFTIPSVTAADSTGYPIELIPHDTMIWIIQPFLDFTMTIVPDSQAIIQGDSADFSISFEPLGEFNSPITLSITNMPEGMQAIFETQPFNIPVTNTITFTTFDEITPGVYYPIITATGGGITHSDTVIIKVSPRSVLSDFAMTVQPDSQIIYQGESTDFTATFQPIGEFDSQISLAISNLPQGMEANYPTDPFSIPDSLDVTFSTTTEISPGTYMPIFTATGGGITHSDTVTIIVLPESVLSDFSMTVVPDSQTIQQGEATEFALSFQPIGEFDARISLDISNLPAGMEAIYPSEPFAIPTSFNVTFSTMTDIEPGVYQPVITATGGEINHQITVTIIVVQRMDFIMTIEPDSQAVSAGDSIEFYISFEPVGGFNSQITVAVSNVPEGMGARYTSRPFSIPFSITVTFRVLRNIPIDVYYPTVTATGGGITHQETVAINVLPAPPTIQGFSVQPNPFTPNNDGFNDYAEFQYPETISGSITISIFDLNGRKITEIRNSRYWYGKDSKGSDVKPGAYIYIVKNGEKVVAKGVIGVAR